MDTVQLIEAIERAETGLSTIQTALTAIKTELSEPDQPEQLVTSESDYVMVTPDNQGVVKIPTTLQPGQICMIDASTTVTKVIAQNVKGEAGKPITIRCERPTQVSGSSYLEDLAYVNFDMRPTAPLTFNNRTFLRRAEHILLQYLKWVDITNVALTMKPLVAGDVMRNIIVRHCDFTDVPTGEGIYIGNNQANADQDTLRMDDITVENCTFTRTAQAFHVSGVRGFSITENQIEDSRPAQFPAHNGAVAVGRRSGPGVFANNTIDGCPINGLILTTSKMHEVEFLDNVIKNVAYARGAENIMPSEPVGVRIHSESVVKFANNVLENIPGIAIRASGTVQRLNDYLADNTFNNVGQAVR